MVTIDVMGLEFVSVKYLRLYDQIRGTVEHFMFFFFLMITLNVS